MNESIESVVRIGIVEFLNTAPITEKFKEAGRKHQWELVSGPPVMLNKQLAEGLLDIGFISTVEYGAHPELYRILSGLSVSASGPAGSVFLFSHLPLKLLNKEHVLLTSKSETSICLGKIVFEEFNGVLPIYSKGDVIINQHDGYKAILATGDDALKLLEDAKYLYQYDLGDMWRRETGLPFVYSICAAREDFCSQHPELLSEVHRELLRCRDEGQAELDDICALSATRIPFTKAKCKEYLQGIEYDLKAEKRRSLEKFFEILAKRGEIKPVDLPLKIFANLQEIL